MLHRVFIILSLIFLLLGGALYMHVFDIFKTEYQPQIKSEQLKQLNHSMKHLALIMDGNRRWAQEQGLEPWVGHKKGTDTVKLSVEFCIEQNIPYLSLYAFSLENFKRSEQELKYLFDTVEAGITNEEFQQLTKHGVRVLFIGNRSLFPARLLKTIADIEAKTAHNKQLTLNLLFCYGGQQELTEAMRSIGRLIAAGQLEPTAITPELIEQHLWSGQMPYPDIIIRTGGKQRLSNFLPWQSTYSELLFLDKYWPAITKDDLLSAVQQFELTQRNFGV